jgi:hypothetical protein
VGLNPCVPPVSLPFHPFQNDDEDPGCGTNQWPYLKACYVPAWKLLVHAHRKSCDDHVRLMLLADGPPVTLDQAETKLVAPVPTIAKGENFVTGMALDYSNQVWCQHACCVATVHE